MGVISNTTTQNCIIAIWEIKDGKLYRGHQISQPVMSIDDSNGTYNKVKV